jgi:hypothetical protein
VDVSSPTGVPDDDAFWQRPDSTGGMPSPAPVPTSPPRPPGGGYQGPPAASPPSPHWRPPTFAQPPAPRSLPPQDIDALEESEGSARTVTYGVGLVAGAVALILMCLLCARAIF